ncbi:MAG: hypothetical protein PHG85_01485 [Candidatus Altiarchaeota archaeon]|nr:hypothetical protein [Candidatus Altiarchaeota archaeon]
MTLKQPDNHKIQPSGKPEEVELRIADDAMPAPVPSNKADAGQAPSKIDPKIQALAGKLNKRHGRLIKAVVARDPVHVTNPTEQSKPTVDDIASFVKLAKTRPERLTEIQEAILLRVSRGTDTNPQDWPWAGRRARYVMATARLNAAVNQEFGTKIPVKDYELDADKLKAYHTKRNTLGLKQQ